MYAFPDIAKLPALLYNDIQTEKANFFEGGRIMPRFFSDDIDRNNIVITGSDAVHIGRSLRMRPGQELTVCCMGTDLRCRIREIKPDAVFLDLIAEEKCTAEPSVEITLFQAVPKGDKLDSIVQKTVELGVRRIVPVLTRRCVSRPDRNDFDRRLERLNKIAESAAKQSGRGIIPEVTSLVSFGEAVERLTENDCPLMLYEEEGGCSFSDIDFAGVRTIGLFIGSEGGFDKEEADLARSSGADLIWLGKRILRCETVPITAMSILMFLTNNM